MSVAATVIDLANPGPGADVAGDAVVAGLVQRVGRAGTADGAIGAQGGGGRSSRGVGLTSTSLVVDYSVIIHKTAPTLQEIFGKLRCQVYGPYPMAYINYHHVTWRISDAIRYI